jgi:hypothetical protein
MRRGKADQVSSVRLVGSSVVQTRSKLQVTTVAKHPKGGTGNDKPNQI